MYLETSTCYYSYNTTNTFYYEEYTCNKVSKILERRIYTVNFNFLFELTIKPVYLQDPQCNLRFGTLLTWSKKKKISLLIFLKN